MQHSRIYPNLWKIPKNMANYEETSMKFAKKSPQQGKPHHGGRKSKPRARPPLAMELAPRAVDDRLK
ncbi:hypothetical protein HAX54_028395 [Datura stramonium]|uniref:Uncharacterized protein n=1 Tax=Datura stramonium TaxID=4076 RepID=A0ABS8S9J1_DATST|nr:hypothetical protein [Datura stramonium]